MIAYLLATLVLTGLILFLFHQLWFCRRPARKVPRKPGIVSPANGRVAVVQRFTSPRARVKKWNRGSVELLCSDVARRGWLVLIVMTPLHVHYQRAPDKGTLVRERYRPGTFRNAVANAEELGTLENERNELLFENDHGRFKVAQIAGVLARRITSYRTAGDAVKRGDLLGFINLGSQVALILPEHVELSVAPGDTVIDGETLLGVWR